MLRSQPAFLTFAAEANPKDAKSHSRRTHWQFYISLLVCHEFVSRDGALAKFQHGCVNQIGTRFNKLPEITVDQVIVRHSMAFKPVPNLFFSSICILPALLEILLGIFGCDLPVSLP